MIASLLIFLGCYLFWYIFLITAQNKVKVTERWNIAKVLGLSCLFALFNTLSILLIIRGVTIVVVDTLAHLSHFL